MDKKYATLKYLVFWITAHETSLLCNVLAFFFMFDIHYYDNVLAIYYFHVLSAMSSSKEGSLCFQKWARIFKLGLTKTA